MKVDDVVRREMRRSDQSRGARQGSVLRARHESSDDRKAPGAAYGFGAVRMHDDGTT